MEPICYDYLVVGLGAVVHYFGTKGAEEYAFPLYTMRDAFKQSLKPFKPKLQKYTEKALQKNRSNGAPGGRSL